MTEPVIKTVTLETPIKRGDKEITEIQVRKPKAGELRGVSLASLMNMDVNELTKVMPRITQPTLASDEIQGMDVADLTQVAIEVAYFFGTESSENGLPDCIEDAMADVAVIFHWPPSEMAAFSLSELMNWRKKAIERSQSEQ